MNINIKRKTPMMKNIFYLPLLIFCVTNAQGHFNQILFGEAIKKGDLERAQKIWAEGNIDVNGSIAEEAYTIYTALGGIDVTKKSYLYVAIGKSEALVQFLLDNGADAKKVIEGHCPLNAAICLGQKKMLELLLSHGAIPSDDAINIAKEKQPQLVPFLESFKKTKL